MFKGFLTGNVTNEVHAKATKRCVQSVHFSRADVELAVAVLAAAVRPPNPRTAGRAAPSHNPGGSAEDFPIAAAAAEAASAGSLSRKRWRGAATPKNGHTPSWPHHLPWHST